jgi:hypothetical protein
MSRAAPQRPGRAGRSASLWRPSLRYGCPAMLGLAAPLRNSLRSLRSLRSNRRNESVHDSRFARGRKPCASRRHRGAPQPTRPGLCGSGFAVGECFAGAPNTKLLRPSKLGAQRRASHSECEGFAPAIDPAADCIPRSRRADLSGTVMTVQEWYVSVTTLADGGVSAKWQSSFWATSAMLGIHDGIAPNQVAWQLIF